MDYITMEQALLERTKNVYNTEGQRLKKLYNQFMSEEDPSLKRSLRRQCQSIVEAQFKRKQIIDNVQTNIINALNTESSEETNDLNPSRFLCDKVWNRRSNR